MLLGVSAAAFGALALTACGGGSKTAAEVRITNGDPDNVCYWDASVSVDGTRLLFQKGLNTGGEIWTETLEGGMATGTRQPVVRKVDGSNPVFVGKDRVAFVNEISTSERELVVASARGSNRRTIPTVDKPFGLTATPDGEWLLYTVLVDKGEALHRVRVDGSGDEQVFTDTWSVDGPVVSPDGTKIAYARYRVGVGDEIVSEVWTARIDGSGRTKVADGGSPIWSPDGKRLALIAPAGKTADGLPLEQVFVVAATGGTPVAITDSEQVKRGSLVWFKNDQIAYVYVSSTADYCQLFAAPAPTPES
jgi:hypothetical protein